MVTVYLIKFSSSSFTDLAFIPELFITLMALFIELINNRISFTTKLFCTVSFGFKTLSISFSVCSTVRFFTIISFKTSSLCCSSGSLNNARAWRSVREKLNMRSNCLSESLSIRSLFAIAGWEMPKQRAASF